MPGNYQHSWTDGGVTCRSKEGPYAPGWEERSLPWRLRNSEGPDWDITGRCLAAQTVGYGWGSYDPIRAVALFQLESGAAVLARCTCPYRNEQAHYSLQRFDSLDNARAALGHDGVDRQLRHALGWDDVQVVV